MRHSGCERALDYFNEEIQVQYPPVEHFTKGELTAFQLQPSMILPVSISAATNLRRWPGGLISCGTRFLPQWASLMGRVALIDLGIPRCARNWNGFKEKLVRKPEWDLRGRGSHR